jgi:hypothetical protein
MEEFAGAAGFRFRSGREGVPTWTWLVSELASSEAGEEDPTTGYLPPQLYVQEWARPGLILEVAKGARSLCSLVLKCEEKGLAEIYRGVRAAEGPEFETDKVSGVWQWHRTLRIMRRLCRNRDLTGSEVISSLFSGIIWNVQVLSALSCGPEKKGEHVVQGWLADYKLRFNTSVLAGRFCDRESILKRWRLFFHCFLGGVSDAFFDFLLLVFLRTRYLGWSSFRYFVGYLVGYLLVILRAGMNKHLRDKIKAIGRLPIWVRTRRPMEPHGDTVIEVVRFIRRSLGGYGKNVMGESYGVEFEVDKMLGVGLDVYVGRGRRGKVDLTWSRVTGGLVEELGNEYIGGSF